MNENPMAFSKLIGEKSRDSIDDSAPTYDQETREGRFLGTQLAGFFVSVCTTTTTTTRWNEIFNISHNAGTDSSIYMQGDFLQ
jgi:hypothetical protein